MFRKGRNSWRRGAGLMGLLILFATSEGAALAEPVGTARPSDPLARLCDLGVSLALVGKTAAAESVFAALLSRSPRDARALNNLGNLHLWRGNADLASAFYRAATGSDSADGGIVLNGATALLLAGDEAGAQSLAEAGVRQAGGVEAAARLLGLPYARSEAEAAPVGDRTRLGREQALLLLKAAARAMPSDSLVRSLNPTGAAGTPRRKSAPIWRPAGARSSQSGAESPVVYWKR